MKLLVFGLLISLSLNTFAGAFSSAVETYESIEQSSVLNQNTDGTELPEYEEFKFEIGVIKADKNQSVEICDLVKLVLHENFTKGLLSMNLTPVKSADVLVSRIATDLKSSKPFFCERIKGDCKKSIEELAYSIFNDKSVGQVSVLNLYGDYYGDWEAAYIIATDYARGSALIVEFDIYHEI